jgi:ribosomal protein S18 acetylase RimI-like enzyme
VGLDEDAPLQNYLAFWEGEAVATASLFCGAGVAGIYNVATLPESRRRGIGRAVTLFALHHARTKGLREAILQSSAAGAGVYKSLGFRERCRFEQYVWSPSQ